MSGAFVGEAARILRDSTTSKTISGTMSAACAAGSYNVVIVNMPGNSANTTMTISDGHNTGTFRQIGVSGAGSNGQVLIGTYPVAVATTTSDTITCTVDNSGNLQSALLVLNFSGLDDYDVGTSTTGATSTALNSGTTATASNANQLVVAGFAHTGSGVVISNIAPSGFTAQMTLQTTTVIRDLTVIWGFTSSVGTRNVTATMDAAHAWAGAIVAVDVTPPPSITFAKTVTIG